MKKLLAIFVIGFIASIARADEPKANVVTTGTLLDEMKDLQSLARWPKPAYRNVQFSSYDRRSTTPEAPGWFSNADGFGGGADPRFHENPARADGGKPGLYLMADVHGPGAIVRGWSAGMAGVLRVYLDPKTEGEQTSDGTLIYEGPAYEFLARRSAQFLKSAGIDLDAKNAFVQTDADYFPIPFANGLKVTWEGTTERTPLLSSPSPQVCGRDRRADVRSAKSI